MPSNIGSQTVTILYHTIASSSVVNKRFQDIRQVGIYEGGYPTIVDDSHASLSTLVCEISDGIYQVRIETGSEVSSIAVAGATPYIVLRWAYIGAASDYMEILAVDTPATNDLVIAKCEFDGSGHLNAFNYQDSIYPRTTPNTHDLFLKVEPTADTELRVRVRAGRIQISSGVIDIADQKSDLFVLPGSDSRIDLVYVTDAGSIAIDSSGTAAAVPTSPAYDGKLVLAEVTVANGDTNITADKIKDVRNFITLPHAVDDVTIEKSSAGKLQVKDNSIDDEKLGTITSVFGVRTNKDSLGVTLVKNTTYKATSDGFVEGWVYNSGEAITYVYSDANNPPTTEIYQLEPESGDRGTFSLLVRKNEYWKVTSSYTPYFHWTPIGNGECQKQ